MAGSQATAGLRGGAVRDSEQHSNSKLTRLGPASARRPGPQQGRGFLTSRSWTRRRGSGEGLDEQQNSLEQRKQGGAVHGFLGDIFPVLQPRSLAFRRGGVEELGEEETDRGGVVLGGSSPGLTTTTAPANGDGNKATSTQSRLDIGGAQVVRRPPQHPSGEGGELTCFRGGGGLVASRCAASEQGSSATTSGFGASATLA
jgi:hypothetical protein